jgi:RNA polymerase sigma-70 factor (ECF subfamily)
VNRMPPRPEPLASRIRTAEMDSIVREAYAAYSVELYGFAVRALGEAGLAEEAVQETFLRAWRAAEQSLLAWQVEEAMRRIGEQYRQVLVETYYRGRPYAEVATELGVPEATVKSRVYDGLRALKVALQEVELET